MSTHNRTRFISSRFILVVAVVIASFLAAFLGQIFITQLSLSPSLLPEPGLIVRTSGEQASVFRQAANEIMEHQRGAFVRLYQRGNTTQPVMAWVVSTDGWIVYTASRSIDDKAVAFARLANGDVAEVTLRLADPATDLRFVKISKERLQPLTITQDAVPPTFESLIAVSHEGQVSLANVVGDGFAATSHFRSDRRERLPHVAIQRGSGQAVYNRKGELVGLLSSSPSDAQSFIPMISASEIRDVLNMVLSSSSIQRPSLGVAYVDLAHTQSLFDGLPAAGAYVYLATGVELMSANSAAAKAGLRPSDIITAVDGIPLSERHTLSDAVNVARIGDALELTVLRNGTSLTLSATIEAATSK